MDMDDTLVLILERIDSPISLIRAASTCRRWRRLIADAGFLRRFRSLHGPSVADDYYNGDPIPDPRGDNRVVGHRPVFVPSSSIVNAHHFSLDFLIDASIFPPRNSSRYRYTSSWNVRDSRGSILLMVHTHVMSIFATNTYQEHPHPYEIRMYTTFPDVVICEPLTQRYKIIPPPPDFSRNGGRRCLLHGPYLVDGDQDEARGHIGMSNFRVLCVLISPGDDVPLAHATVFTAGGSMDSTWSEKAIDPIASRIHPRVRAKCLGCALGSCYFYVQQDGTLITRDGSTGKFSSSMLSQAIKSCWDRHFWTDNFSVVNGGDGEPRIVAMMDRTMEVFARVDGEWTLENKIFLSKVTSGLPGYQLSFFSTPLTIVKRGVGFVVIYSEDLKQNWSFSIDLKTMKAAPAADGSMEKMAYRCEFPWPPRFCKLLPYMI